MKVTEFVGPRVIYDKMGQIIFSVDEKTGHQLLLELSLRGWGAIQHHFDNENDAGKFQDEVGQWIADAINEKLFKS
jgi:hypothetical protein